jgi:hypothetical protein
MRLQAAVDFLIIQKDRCRPTVKKCRRLTPPTLATVFVCVINLHDVHVYNEVDLKCCVTLLLTEFSSLLSHVAEGSTWYGGVDC